MNTNLRRMLAFMQLNSIMNEATETSTLQMNYSRGAIYHPTKSQKIKRKKMLARK